MAKLRVGVIGLGVGEQHVVGYQENRHCEVVGLCDRDPDALARVRRRVPGARTALRAADLLADPTIDLLSIASNDDDHFSQVCAALENSKHVFVEKPLCQSLDQLKTVKQNWAQQRGRLRLKSNLVLRGAPVYGWLREKVRSGEMGQVYAFDGDYLYGRLEKITDGWRADVEDYSVMEGGGIHLIDLMLWITGERPSTVDTAGNRMCTAGTAFRYKDFAAATFTFPSGMIGRITANFGCVHGHQHVVRIFGTEATLVYDDQGPRYQTHRDPAPPAKPLQHAALPPSKYVLIDEFVDAIVRDRDIDEEAQLDFDVMSVCIASDTSLRIGGVQEIEYV